MTSVLPLSWQRGGADDPSRALGARVRSLRLHAFLTQDGLARLAGLAAPTIQRLEQGRCRPRIHTIRAIAAALQVTPEQLVPHPSQLWTTDSDA